MLYRPNPHSEPEVRRCSGQPLPDMVVVLGLWYPRAQLALWAVRAHCWLAFNLQLGRTPRSFSVGLIFSVLVLSLYMLRAAPSQVQNPALLLENSMQLVIAQLSSFSRSLCKASLPSRESAAPPSLELSANVLGIPSSPASKSLTKTLKRIGPQMEPWGTPLVTGHHLDGHPLTFCLIFANP